MPDLAVSSWSLHRLLGPTYPALELSDGERVAAYPYGAGNLTLLETPAFVAAMGLSKLEICHFHFPRTDAAYLDELRKRFGEAEVRFTTLLVDAGDLTADDAAERERDMARIKGWIDVAAAAGAERIRAIAGFAQADPGGVAVRRSIDGLATLAEYGRERGVAVITENWQALTTRPENLLAILDGLDGAVGLCGDFGNYGGATRFDDLAAILPRAVTIHAKTDQLPGGALDAAPLRRCLDL